jgi:hypothetical protein
MARPADDHHMDSGMRADQDSGMTPEADPDKVARSVPSAAPAVDVEMPLDTDPAETEDEQVEAERTPLISTPAEVQHSDADAAPILGLRWAVTDEPNPFHRRLVLSTDGMAVLDLSLDPLLLQDLLASLAYVRDAQRAVLGLVDAPISTPVAPAASPGPAPTAPASVEAEPTDALTDSTHPVSMESDASVAATTGLSTPSAFTTFAWWRSHKLLAFLLIFGAVFFIVGSLTSPG